MKITEGLFDNMVLQRAQGNRSDAAFSGECSGAGALRATVRAQGRVLAGFNDIEVLALAAGVDAQTIPAGIRFTSAWQAAGYPGDIPAPARIVNVRDFGAATRPRTTGRPSAPPSARSGLDRAWSTSPPARTT